MTQQTYLEKAEHPIWSLTDPDEKKVVQLVSGGMDSVTLLYDFDAHGFDVVAVVMDYGQTHSAEVGCALYHTVRLGIKTIKLDMRNIFSHLGGCLVEGNKLPIPGAVHREDEKESRIVANRNMIFLAVAGGIAHTQGVQYVSFAGTMADAEYPDCLPEFVTRLSHAMQFAIGVQVVTPYDEMDKSDVVLRAHDLKQHGLDLSMTHTCFHSDHDHPFRHCGICSSCGDRIRAFVSAGITDPTDYQDRSYLHECNNG